MLATDVCWLFAGFFILFVKTSSDKMLRLCARFRPAFVVRFLRFKSTDNRKSAAAAAAEWHQIAFQTKQKKRMAPPTEIDPKKDYFVADDNMTFDQLKEIISHEELGKIEKFQKEYQKILTERENKYPQVISAQDWLKFLRHPNCKDDSKQFLLFLKDSHGKQCNVNKYQTMDDLRASLSPQDSVRLDRAMEEYEMASYLDSWLPSRISPDGWDEILKMKSPAERLRYFRYLGQREMRAEREKANKLQKLNDPNYGPVKMDSGHMDYRLFGDTIFIRTNEERVRQSQDSRVLHPLMMGKPTICVDTSYMHIASVTLRNLTVKQLHQAYCVNRAHQNPCQLLFTDADLSADFWAKYLKTSLVFLQQPKTVAAELTSKSFLDLFPRERLVYLTPDSRQELHKFDEDDVYILGAMVDKYKTGVRASIGKAKEFGIRHCRLPLDSNVEWSSGGGGKKLTLGHVLGMLLDVHLNGDWKSAIENNVPRRKLVQPENWMQRAEHSRLHKAREAFVLENLEQ